MKITPEMRVKIRRGQYWKKKDSGLVVQITSSKGSDKFSYRNISNYAHTTHSVRSKELWMFWEPL